MADPEKIGEKGSEKTPPSEESKPLGLGGKRFGHWIETDDAWQVSQMPRGKRRGLEQRLFGSKGYTSQKAKEICRDIKSLPDKSKEKYGIESDTERKQILRILEKSLEE